jgi:hypothetical protein
MLKRLWQFDWANWALVGAAIWAACIALRTLRSIEDQTTIALKSANAAQRSADALIRENMPYLFVEEITMELVDGDNPVLRTHALSVVIRNYGLAPAFLKAVCTQCEIMKSPQAGPQYVNLPEVVPPGMAFGADERRSLPNIRYEAWQIGKEDHRIELAARANTKDRAEYLYALGYLKFADIFDKQYVTGFAWIYDPVLRCLRVATEQEAPGYNYFRPE